MHHASAEVLTWVRSGFPDGVPDADAPVLYRVLRERLGSEQTLEIVNGLRESGALSAKAAAALVPNDEDVRRVSAQLVLGGWPLAGDSDDDEGEGAREGTRLGRILDWLRDGYPGGVPHTDYLPLLALLERRLTSAEVKQIAKALRRADVSPAGPDDIAAAIQSYTDAHPAEADLRRVRDQLAKKGWPLDFPDPDLP